MQHLNPNIKNRPARPSSFSAQGPNQQHFPSNNNSSYTRPPIIQYPNRPATHSQYLSPYQSNIYLTKPPNNNLTTQNKLSSFAREVPRQQENIRVSASHQLHLNKSHEKFQNMGKNYLNSRDPNLNGRRPMRSSTFALTSQANSTIDLHQRIEKKNQIFIQTVKTEESPHIPLLQFNQKLKNGLFNSQRLYKTDREASVKKVPFNNNFLSNKADRNYSRTLQVPDEGTKQKSYELNSTLHSDCSTNFIFPKKQSQQSSKSNQNSIKKNFSPSNIWPLSTSPSEQKRQNVFDPFACIEAERKDSNDEPSNTEFKKKKNFQFLKNLKKKSNVSPLEVLVQKSWSIDDFDLLDKIGKGSFGDVFMAQEKKIGFLCVIKKLLKKKIIDNKLEEHLMRQIKIQSYLNHRHLTPLYGCFSDEKYIYLALEYMPDGSLMQVKKRKKISESHASLIVRQICLGLKYLHTEKIIHRDIKPQNIFLFDNYAKIGDFGCSVYSLTHRNTQIGSFAYVSPEQLKLQEYNQKIDVWSVGVMTYQMIFGVAPFEAEIIESAKQQKAPQFSKLTFPQTLEISFQARDFLTKMLSLNPLERLGIDEALRHEFILKYIRTEQGVSSSPHP